MPDDNENDRVQRLKKFYREFFQPPEKGCSWLLQYGCFPIAIALVAVIVAIIAGRYAIEVARTSVEPPPAPPKVQEFTVGPSEIFLGERVTLRWKVTGVKIVSIKPLTQSFPAEGHYSDTPRETTEYSLFISTEEEPVKIWQVIVNPLPTATPTRTSIPAPTETTSAEGTPSAETPAVTMTSPSTPASTLPPPPPPPLPPPPSPPTPIPRWATCISNDPGRTAWRLGDTLPASGCSCLAGNWFCCPSSDANPRWRLLRGIILPVGEAPTYPNFTNQFPSAPRAWAQRWFMHNYRLIFANTVDALSRIGLIVGQQPPAQNQCVPFASNITVQVAVTPPPTPTDTPPPTFTPTFTPTVPPPTFTPTFTPTVPPPTFTPTFTPTVPVSDPDGQQF